MRFMNLLVALTATVIGYVGSAEAQIQRFHISAPLQGVDFYIADSTGAYAQSSVAAAHIPALSSTMFLNTDPAIDAGLLFGNGECGAYNQLAFNGYRVTARDQRTGAVVGFYYHCIGFLGGDTYNLRLATNGVPSGAHIYLTRF